MTSSVPAAKTARVIVCSDSAAAGTAPDTTGPAILEYLRRSGFSASHQICPDDQQEISDAISTATAAGDQLVVCTGGTGIGPRDVTPEAIRTVCRQELPGFGEAMRAQRDTLPQVDLSRALAAVVDRSLVVALPGSPGGVKDGLAILDRWLTHALALLSDSEVAAGPRRSHSPQHHHHHHPAPKPLTNPTIALAEITTDVINPGDLASRVEAPACGAVASFIGQVRNADLGKTVTHLVYEAHPDAAKFLNEVVTETVTDSGIHAVAVAHRLGPLTIGDVAFCVAVSSPHRSEAFTTVAAVVNAVKANVPIWKDQYYADGTHEWVACP